ncbi:hypothetical protein [Pseudomonas oryzihabitans]|uniref:hypothetical protein n=1 Tax=Pseudomonas oryzihabitans TaxID=47885 RepID=UPI002894C848|nr:hypothetical protein [Pseudomonas oryzihabitans]MDT3721559.1 hypothetical protein [Pseudomonas oryzihabitans]
MAAIRRVAWITAQPYPWIKHVPIVENVGAVFHATDNFDPDRPGRDQPFADLTARRTPE